MWFEGIGCSSKNFPCASHEIFFSPLFKNIFLCHWIIVFDPYLFSSRLGSGIQKNRASIVLRTLSKKTIKGAVTFMSWSRHKTTINMYFLVLGVGEQAPLVTCFWLAYEFADRVAMNKQIPSNISASKFLCKWAFPCIGAFIQKCWQLYTSQIRLQVKGVFPVCTSHALNSSSIVMTITSCRVVSR